MELVDFAKGLPLENRVYNDELHKKYRELTRTTTLRRLREVTDNINHEKIVIPFSRRCRSRYCRLAVEYSLRS